jgi:hypothetical protein
MLLKLKPAAASVPSHFGGRQDRLAMSASGANYTRRDVAQSRQGKKSLAKSKIDPLLLNLPWLSTIAPRPHAFTRCSVFWLLSRPHALDRQSFTYRALRNRDNCVSSIDKGKSRSSITTGFSILKFPYRGCTTSGKKNFTLQISARRCSRLGTPNLESRVPERRNPSCPQIPGVTGQSEAATDA